MERGRTGNVGSGVERPGPSRAVVCEVIKPAVLNGARAGKRSRRKGRDRACFSKAASDISVSGDTVGGQKMEQ